MKILKIRKRPIKKLRIKKRKAKPVVVYDEKDYVDTLIELGFTKTGIAKDQFTQDVVDAISGYKSAIGPKVGQFAGVIARTGWFPPLPSWEEIKEKYGKKEEEAAPAETPKPTKSTKKTRSEETEPASKKLVLIKRPSSGSQPTRTLRIRKA